MTSIMLCAALALLALTAMFFSLWRGESKKRRELKESYRRAQREISAMEEAAKAAGKNRREADEKIVALHDGNAVDNALHELQKR